VDLLRRYFLHNLALKLAALALAVLLWLAVGRHPAVQTGPAPVPAGNSR
jgi:hypothetical protein